MKQFLFHIHVTQEEDGSFFAEVKELPGCFTAGESLEEIKRNMPEAIVSYMMVLTDTAEARVEEATNSSTASAWKRLMLKEDSSKLTSSLRESDCLAYA